MPRPSKGARLYLRRKAGREAVYVIIDGAHEESTGFNQANFKKAEVKLHEYLASKQSNGVSDSSPDQNLAAEMLAYYYDHRAPQTAKPELIGYHIANLLPYWGAKTIPDITPETCRGYVTWRCSQIMPQAKKTPKFVSVATARRELETLQAAINYFHRQKRLPPTVPLDLPEKSEPKERWLKRDEAARLLWAARGLRAPHLTRFILTGLYTGSRKAVILGLRWLPSTDSGWIDLEHGVIYRKGPAQKKTNKKRPAIRIPARLLPHLKRWAAIDARGYQSGRMRIAGKAEKPLTHLITYKGDPIKDIDNAFGRARTLAGLGPEVTPHTLRHTLATWAMQGGAEPWEAAGFAGMSLKVMQSTYAHHSPDHQLSVSKALSRASKNK
jgi:integrase